MLADFKARKQHRPDYLLGLIVLILISIGMIIIYSTGSIVNFNISSGATDRNSFFNNQLISLGVGVICWVIASRFPYKGFKKLAPWLLGASVIAMLLVFVPGLSGSSRGASRWIRLGSLSFQPAEFLKLSLIISFATWADANRENLRKFKNGFLPILGALIVTLFLTVVLQRDMGTGVVLVFAILGAYFMSDAPLRLFSSLIASLLAGGLMLIALFPYRLARVTTFFNHTEDPTGSGYHINQALIALGSGGILGRGLGNSLQSYGYLPESTNDSVYAIIGEQFGLWGTLTIIILFVILLFRFLRIIQHAPDRYARILASGLTAWLIAQAFINIAAMLNIIPLTGIPLPFISYGGTSLAASMIAVGIMQNISRYTEREAEYADRPIGRRNRRTRDADHSPEHSPAAVSA
ncbi:MAG: putative lipid II flippase FtsW [bacterium]